MFRTVLFSRPIMVILALEVNLQSELNVSWRVGLPSDLAKARRIVNVRVRRTKNRAIKNIEKLRAELHVEGLADLGYVRPLNDAQVFIQESKSPHIRLVRTHVSEGKGHRLSKGSDVQVRVSGGVKLPP